MNNRIITFFQTFWVLFRISKELWGDCTSKRTQDVNTTLLFFHHSPLRSIILKMWTIMNHRILFFLKCSIVNFLFSTVINCFFYTWDPLNHLHPWNIFHGEITWIFLFSISEKKSINTLKQITLKTSLICVLLFKKRF